HLLHGPIDRHRHLAAQLAARTPTGGGVDGEAVLISTTAIVHRAGRLRTFEFQSAHERRAVEVVGDGAPVAARHRDRVDWRGAPGVPHGNRLCATGAPLLRYLLNGAHLLVQRDVTLPGRRRVSTVDCEIALVGGDGAAVTGMVRGVAVA